MQLPLPAAVSAELARLEAELEQAADPLAPRSRLADRGEAAEVSVLWRRAWEQRHAERVLSAYIDNAPGLGLPSAVNAAARQEEPISEDNDVQLEVQIPGQQIHCRLQNEERATASAVADLMDVDGNEVEVEGSPGGWILISPDGLQNHQSPTSTVYSSVSNRERAEAGYPQYQMPNDPAQDLTLSPVSGIAMRVQQMDGLSGRVGVATRPSLPNGNSFSASPQMLALGELEFDRRFLIFVYLADKKIEEVLDDVNYIRYLKSLPMDSFESEIWNKFGKKSVPAAERRKNLDWDSSNVEIKHDSLVTGFKGPYVDNRRTYLQKVVGDDNILIVKFADIPGLRNSVDNFGMPSMFYHQVAEDVRNILVQGCKHTALSLYLLEKRQSELLLEEENVPTTTATTGAVTSNIVICSRRHSDLFKEACAVYQVVYERAVHRNDVSMCRFAWKVASLI